MKQTPFINEQENYRPFTSYREMLPLLRSQKAEDKEVFAVRLALTSPDNAYDMLHSVLAAPHGPLPVFSGPYLILRLCGNIYRILLKLPFTFLIEELSNIFLLLSVGNSLWTNFYHRGTRSAVRYNAAMNDPRALPLLIKFLHRFPVTKGQRLWNEQTYQDITRLFDELDVTQLENIATILLRSFFERQYFHHLRKSRRPVSDTYTYMMVSILRFLLHRPTVMEKVLAKQILSEPAPSERCANAKVILFLREVAEALPGQKTPALKPLSPPATEPAISPLNTVIGRIGWLEWKDRNRH